MTFSRNTLLTAVVALTVFSAVNEVRACRGGGGGGYSGGYSSRSYSSYNRYHSVPSHNYGYSSRPVQYVQAAPAPRTVQIAPQPVIQPQPVVQSQPVQQVQPVQPVSQSQQVAQQQQVAPAPQPQTTQPQPTAPAPVAGNTAQMSALQALGGFAPPAANPPAPQSQTPAHVGNWTATLGNGATVRLSLQADGRFEWVATNKSGSSSSFAGTYTVNNGSLNLNRANDNQQLSGGMTTSGNDSFSFQVAGTNAASINFARS